MIINLLTVFVCITRQTETFKEKQVPYVLPRTSCCNTVW